MGGNLIETIMGAVVLLVAGLFAVFAYNSSNVSTGDGYELSAKFQSVDGLALGGDVRIGGIKVGSVARQALDNATYMAIVTMNVQEGVEIPADSTAAVVSDGLLGGKYIAITPGGDDKMLESGGEIKFTQSAVNLETLIGKFMFSGGGVDGGKEPEEKSKGGEAPAQEQDDDFKL